MRTTFFVLIILFVPFFGNITYCQKTSTIISSPEAANRERIKRTKIWKEEAITYGYTNDTSIYDKHYEITEFDTAGNPLF